MIDFQSAPVTVTKITDGFKVCLKGAIHTNTAWVDNELKRVADAGPKVVELDLSDVNYVSSSGLGTLSTFYRGVTAHGGVIRVVAVQPQVFGVLRHARMDELFKISPEAVIKPAGK